MSISCGVMNDLLPLYQEGLLGADSVALVEEHLAGCAHCSQALKELRQAPTPAPSVQAPLQQVGARIKRDTWRRIAIAVAVVVFLGSVLFYHSTTRHYLRYSPELVTVKEVSPGKVVVEGRGVTGVWSQVLVPARSDVDRGLVTGTAVYLAFYGPGAKQADSTSTFTTTFEEQGELQVFYTYPGEPAVRLHGPAGEDEGFILLPRLALTYYLMYAIAVAAVLALLLLVLYKRPQARRVLIPLLCVPLCYLLAHFAIKGTGGASWDMLRDLAFILVAWIAASAAVLLMLRQRRASL